MRDRRRKAKGVHTTNHQPAEHTNQKGERGGRDRSRTRPPVNPTHSTRLSGFLLGTRKQREQQPKPASQPANQPSEKRERNKRRRTQHAQTDGQTEVCVYTDGDARERERERRKETRRQTKKNDPPHFYIYIPLPCLKKSSVDSEETRTTTIAQERFVLPALFFLV